MKKIWKQTMETHPEAVLPFVCGVLCGVMLGMLAVPFSKGVVIGSYNNCDNKGNGCENSMSVESVKGLPVRAGKKESKENKK